MQWSGNSRLGDASHFAEKIMHRQKEPSLWIFLALSYRSVLPRHSQDRFDGLAQRPQLLDKSRDLTAVPGVGQHHFDLAQSPEVRIESINDGLARRVKSGKLSFELGVFLGRADGFLDPVPN